MGRDWTRRELIERLGAAGLLGALAGCPSDDPGPGPDRQTPTPRTPGPTPESETPLDIERRTGERPPDAERYETVVDIAEAGGDTSGSESVLPILESLDPDDTLVRFPPGEYRLDGSWRVEEFEHLAVVGPEATITTEPGLTGPLFGLGGDGDARDLAIAGLTFDFRQANTGPRPIHAAVEDGLAVSDVTVRGEMDIDQDGMRFDVTRDEGTGVVRRLRMPDGGDPRFTNTGCYVGEAHRGHIAFTDCHVDGFPDNGLYASPAVGRVDVVGGVYRNSGVSNVRVSGPATVRGVTVRCNEARAGVPNMRGIRLREGSDVLVENCRVIMENVTSSDGGITCAKWLNEATIRNTHVTVAADDVPAVWAKSPDAVGSDARRHPIQLRRLTVDGPAARGAAVVISERNGTLIEDLCLCQSGLDRDGVHVLTSTGSVLRGANITVTGRPLVTRRSSLERGNVHLHSLGRIGVLGGPSCGCR
ncbi:hypothetical protein [Haloarcula amylovorans]|uniref:hypothetical protein n=1 Tax=Haloarcula amylovorans TaxID=2562280 RepID=UPI001075DF6D|nr:hypothetical protein [Halomicroarcula amylolytica]